jgi:hypothetical protein
MNLQDLIQKIRGLSPAELEIQRRELDCIKPVQETAVPRETIGAMKEVQRASSDERCMPIEDVQEKPKPED